MILSREKCVFSRGERSYSRGKRIFSRGKKSFARYVTITFRRFRGRAGMFRVPATRNMIIILTTTPDIEEAETLAAKIVSSGLAACVQVLPQITSFYVWEGKLQREGEYLLLIKTLEEKYDELHALISENHSYDVPEVVAIDAARVSDPYLAWMRELLG